MGYQSRDLREKVVRGLAKVGLVWALAVLGALFTAMSALAHETDGGYALSAQHAQAHSAAFGISPGEPPSTAGLALALMILGGGVTVLAVGAARGHREVEPEPLDAELDPRRDLSLALGLGLFA
jgi:hypothetical protein